MSNVQKGMIIAFFVIFGVISTVSSLVGRPWSTVKNFLHRYYKRGTVENLTRTGRPEVLTKRDKRTILSYALYGRTGCTLVNKSAESTSPFRFPPSVVCSTNTT